MKKCWVGPTEVTTAFRAYTRLRGAFIFPVEIYDIALPTLGYPTPHVLRWCDQPFDISFFTPTAEGGAAAVYASGVHVNAAGIPEPSPVLQRGTRKESIGVEVDSLDIDVFLDGTEVLPAADGGASTERFTISEALLAGLFDGAVVTVRRLHLPLPPVWPIEPTGIAPRQLTASGSVGALVSYLTGGGELGPGDTSLGAVTLFAGLCTESTVSRSKATLTVKSALEKLNVGIPRNIYQAGCLNDLGDRMCKVDVEAGSYAGLPFKVTGAISSYPVPDAQHPRELVLVTSTYPTDTAFPGPADYFEGGTLQFTTGPMAGLTFAIEHPGENFLWPVSVTEVQFVTPLPRIPAPGDAVVLRAGCRKTVADCTGKFGNFVGTKLTAGINASVTTIAVASTRNTPEATAPASKRHIRIDDEIIGYADRTDTAFTGCTRGTTSDPDGTNTPAASHAAGALVYPVETITLGTDPDTGQPVIYRNIALNGIRFRGMVRVPPPESAV